jgi:DNA polymerase-1
MVVDPRESRPVAPARRRLALPGLDRPQTLELPAVHPAQRGRPRFSTDSDRARRAVAKAGWVSVDLETKGLSPHASEDADIGAVILKAGKERFLLRDLPDWWPDVLADESTPKYVHNAKFDLAWMIEHCPTEQGQVYARGIKDTMLASQLVNHYRTKSGAQKAGMPDAWVPNDLATCLDRNLGITIGKQIDHETTDWTGNWSSEMIDYMLEDIDYLEPLSRVLDAQIRKDGMEWAQQIENNVVFGTAWMGVNGLLPDLDLWQRAIKDWREQHQGLLDRLQVLWPGVSNFNSPKQIKATSEAVLGFTLPSTRKSLLKQMAGAHEAIDVLLDQRLLATRLKNWGPTFLRKYLCPYPDCGRLHPSWNQIGTETARFSCSRPNAQQFPRAPEFRRMIVAPPGHRLVSLDYSAIEVVAAAVYAQDTALLAACRTGDPHLATARLIAGDDSITKDDPRRQNAKIANFGLLFGGGAQALVTQARDLFDVQLSITEAQKLHREYFRIYPGLQRTRSLAYDRIQTGPACLDVVNTVGFVRYLEGFNRKPTSVLNTRIQSDAGFGIKASFGYLHEMGLFRFLVGQIHDELLFEFPEEQADELAGLARSGMLAGMRSVLGRTAPVSVEINIGTCWL